MKGINFIEPLFHATIERRKRQTRRIMKSQPIFNTNGAWIGGGSDPRYKNGERLYLKEPYRLESRGFGVYEVHYLFGGAPKLVDTTELGIPAHKIASIIRSQKASKNGFANKLFMPEWAARHFIRITETPRPERLQVISDGDCVKEGIESIPDEFRGCHKHQDGYGEMCYNSDNKCPLCIVDESYREAYAALIDRINGRGTWDSNPVVYVYDYELIEIPQ